MRGIAVVFLLIVMLTAGCIGGDSEEVDPAEGDGNDDENSETTGRIIGKVLRDDFEVVAEGEVYLIFGDELVDDTLTDEEGMYAFEGLEPGDYRVRVTDPCCDDDLSSVRVTAGATVEHNPQLRYIPPVVSWVDTSGEWEGFVGCSLNYPTAFEPYTCPDPNNNVVKTFPVEPQLKTIAVYMDWDKVVTSSSENMRHWLHVPADDSRATARYEQGPPIEYRVDATDELTLPFDEIVETVEFKMQVWGPPQGPQFSYQQPFTVHWHLFYGEPAPSGYSAAPDG